jgi:PTS system nitrogen regulatory IIA component
MQLRDFLNTNAIKLDLKSQTRDDVLRELIGLLDVDDKNSAILLKMLKRRENLGSTGIGRGIALPHCRSLVVDRLKLAYGRTRNPVEYRSVDGKPVTNFFMIVAPPLEISNDYLPVLGRLAQFAKQPDVPERLASLKTADELLELLSREPEKVG